MKKVVLVLLCIFCTYANAALSPSAFKKLEKAQKLIEQNQFKQAKEILIPMLETSSTLTKSYTLQTLSSINLEKNQYKKAIKNYEEILQLKAFKKNDLQRVKFVLSQLYLSEQNYKKSIDYSLMLLTAKNIQKKRLYENLSLAYYYDKNYKKSIPYVNKLIDIKQQAIQEYNKLSKEERKKKSKPNIETWYKILYSSYFELKQYKKAIVTLEYLIKHFESKEEYWMQLVLIYQNLEKPKKMLSTLELAYDKGLISHKQNIQYFVNILLQEQLYNKAAQLMQEGLQKSILKDTSSNFALLVSAHVNAKNHEQAIDLLTSNKHAKTPLYQIMLANIYYNDSKYKKSIQSLEKKPFKNGSKYKGQKEILLALAYYELEEENRSKKYLRKAMNNKHEKKRARRISKQLGYKL